MASRFTELIVDCHDPRRLADFWCATLGYDVVEDCPDYIEISGWHQTVEAVRDAPTAPAILFLKVPDSKIAKNRLHLDINPIDSGQNEEVERLIGLGAHRVDIGQGEQRWIVLEDPEGNEFCVLPSLHG